MIGSSSFNETWYTLVAAVCVCVCVQTDSVSDHYPIELRIRFTHRTSGPSYDTSGYRTASANYEAPSALRIGAFNVRVFGQKKVADADILDVLVQVFQHTTDLFCTQIVNKIKSNLCRDMEHHTDIGIAEVK